MSGLGSGDGGAWTFLDLVGLMGFCIGLQNLDLNISQENLDNQTKELDAELRQVVDSIHQHLEEQDRKLAQILEVLDNDSRRNL